MKPRSLPLKSVLAVIGLSLAIQSFGTSTVHQHIRFDDNWRFQVDPNQTLAGEQITDWKWIPAKDITALDFPGLPDTWGSSEWKHANIGQDVFGGRPGFAWFKTTLTSKLLAKANLKRVIHFESVDDNCEVFLNGKKLIKHLVWDDPFDVQLDSAWSTTGPNELVLLVENTAGGGGIAGPVTVQASKEEVAPEFARPSYNDQAWRIVHLPHDYLLEGKFTPTANPDHGSLPQIPAWYRKTFRISAALKGKDISVAFDGVYRNSIIWINGHKLGRHTSGYMGFRHELAPYLHYGGSNELSVFVDPRQSEGWWYEGAGIYRHVWLDITDPIHVAPDGAFVTSALKGQSALLTVQTPVVNGTAKEEHCVVISQVTDPKGKVVVTIKSGADVGRYHEGTLTQYLHVGNAKLWSIETPQLYNLHTTVVSSGRIVDVVDSHFGIRTIRFDANNGFFLNGKPVKLKGTCNHQDFIGVGIGMPDSVLDWRVKQLKLMGSNSYRCSHNPPAKELLDACDRQGMVVMDENRHLGEALGGKTPHGAKSDDLSELRDMILRDRNHPSIIIWSMCNEEPLQGTEEGRKIFAAMMKEVHRWDLSRPISCAMNGGWGYGITLVEDLQGANYNPGGYDNFHKKFPKMPFYGSETASAVSTRGEYVNDKVKGYVSAYDVNFPSWAQTAQVAWKALADRPFMAGGFVWTGFDYKGEPTPYGWPCINSHFGIMDMCGFPKDSYYYYKSWWGDKPTVHVFPHWNWKGKEGQPINVWVHSNCDEVELFLNGKSLGRKKMPHLEHLEWNVNYQPGSLVAKGYYNHKVIASDRVETTGAPAAIVVSTDRTQLVADGEDVSMVAVKVVDAKGRVVPYASNLIKFSVTGVGTVAGVGNGDPSCHEADKADHRSAFHGLCMVLVGANNTQGAIHLRVTSPGLKAAKLEFRSGPATIKDGS